jgi:hypothetical protein
MTLRDSIKAKIAEHQAEIDKLTADLVGMETWLDHEVEAAKAKLEELAAKVGSYL